MDIAQLFRYLFTLHSLTIYPPRNTTPKHHELVRHRVGLRGSAIEIDSKKGSASQKGWEPLLYTNPIQYDSVTTIHCATEEP